MFETTGRHAKSGETIVRHLAEEPAFEGIGYATAAKLWKSFGDNLYALLGNGDAVRLADVLGADRAERLVLAWREKLAEGDVVVWLDEHGFDARLAKKIIRLWGADAAAKLRESPYVMMALADWAVVDAAGRKIGVSTDDPRRLVAAVESVLYARLDQHHTWIGHRDLVTAVGRLLKCPPAKAEEALAAAVAQRAAIPIGGGFQAAGAHMMERYVADRIREMLAEPAMGDLIAREVSDGELHAWLDRQDLGVALDDEQREAVRIAVQERFGIVRGGAGVGKTTVLKAVARACASFGRTTHMMALAGRAAVRISEAAGWPASTIAAFLKGVEARNIALGPESLVVIDEASMLDLPTMYRILRSLPDGCRLLLVGDAGQLPPIQFGLVLHALVERNEIPSVELTRVYRQTEATGIPAVASAVRAGQLPGLPDKVDAASHGVALISSSELSTDQIVDVVADLGGFAEELRIVCAVKAGPAGTEALNARFHDIFAVGRRRHPTRRLAEGEPVMFLKNDYQLGLRNGSLGRITGIEDGKVTTDFDGTEVELSGYGLDDLALAYAITVHKAQGSSFRKVVIPIQKTRLLDRSLVYTAVTRATDLAVMVGDSEVLKQALRREAHAERRETALGLSMDPSYPTTTF
ncbi:AAA family ATPase [Bradyrhizobium sp. CCBAU 11386]|uniref:AAA family ATPase n=1 Tax=Bradyrhizobium sp. CCBAU 11386 TaxID=1630837 RepID=UPI0023049D46|nr:AAA family ATPase [Bradyrhizobium sp. CCBAU 11386]